MDFLNSLLPTIEHFRILGYWIIFAIALLESLAFVGIVIPGSVFIILVGFISSKGSLNIVNLILFASVGAIIGDSISYYLGSHAKKLFKKDSQIFKSKYLEIGKTFFNKHGGVSVLLGRFIGPIRPIIPFVAGMFKMNRRKFVLWNIFSGFTWAAAFLLTGFFFGQAMEKIILWSARGTMIVIILISSLFVLYTLRWLAIKIGKQVLLFLSSLWNSLEKAILANPPIHKLIKKHIYFFEFLKNRVSKNNFLGLPTTLLSLSFIYTFFLFLGVVEDIVTSDTIVSLDTHISNTLSVFRNTNLVHFFLWITLLGKWQIVLSFLITTIGLLWTWHKRYYITPLLVTILGSTFFTTIGKIAFHRPRPELAVYIENSFSFPSGHATIAVAFYGFLTYIIIRNYKQWKTKVNIFFIGLSVILLIGFSRLYLGVHYLSDVWGGYLIGTLWLIIGISISEWLHSIDKKYTKIPIQIKEKIIPTILISASLLFYITFAINYHP